MKKASCLLLCLLLLLLLLLGCTSSATEDFGDIPEGVIPIDQLPQEYSLDMARDNGDYIVDLHGKISNKSVMADFLENVENGEDAFIRTVKYTIEGDPIIHDFSYNEGKYRVTIDKTRDKYTSSDSRIIESREYKYLKIFEANGYSYLVVADTQNFDDPDFDYFSGDHGVVFVYDYSLSNE